MFNIYKLNARGEEEEETKFLERDLKRVDFNNCYYYLYPPTYLKNYHLYSAMSVPTVHTHTPEKRNTPMGRGFLVETREDGFEKVVSKLGLNLRQKCCIKNGFQTARIGAK